MCTWDVDEFDDIKQTHSHNKLPANGVKEKVTQTSKKELDRHNQIES